MFAIAANLASIYQNPTHVNVQPNASYPVWTIGDVIAAGSRPVTRHPHYTSGTCESI
jgi:hypothetical protein